MGALYLVYKTNFFRVCWEDENVDGFFKTLALTAIGTNLSIMMYLTIYLPLVTGKNVDVEKQFP